MVFEGCEKPTERCDMFLTSLPSFAVLDIEKRFTFGLVWSKKLYLEALRQ